MPKHTDDNEIKITIITHTRDNGRKTAKSGGWQADSEDAAFSWLPTICADAFGKGMLTIVFDKDDKAVVAHLSDGKGEALEERILQAPIWDRLGVRAAVAYLITYYEEAGSLAEALAATDQVAAWGDWW